MGQGHSIQRNHETSGGQKMERLTIVSDPFYNKSTWYQQIVEGIRAASSKVRTPIEINILSDVSQNSPSDELSSPVIVTNGSKSFLNHIVHALRRLEKPIVLSGLDSENFGEDISCATCSRRAEMHRLIHYLVHNGRQRIALVGFWTKSQNDMLYFHAAKSAALRAGTPIAEDSGFLWEGRLEESLSAFFRQSDRYDAVVCPNDAVALCVANSCREHSIQIPDRLFLTGASNMQIGQFCDPSLTTIAVDFYAIGEETFHVWHYIHDHEPGQTYIKALIPGKLIVRASTAFCADADWQEWESDVPDESNFDQENSFFTDPMIHSLMRVEHCLHNMDEVDQKILVGILQGKSYEVMAEELYMSTSTIRYRRNRIFGDAGLTTRSAFEAFMREQLNID